MFSNPIPFEQLQDRVKRRLETWVLGPSTPAGARPLPSHHGLPLLGQILALTRDPLTLFHDAMKQRGDAVRIPLAFYEMLLFNHPQAYEHALIRNYHNYGRGLSHKLLRAVVGLGVFTAENDEWLDNRRIAAPRFTQKALQQVDPAIDVHLERWIRRWDRAAERGETRALALDFMAMTSQIGWQALFGLSMSDDEAVQFTADFIGLQDDLFRRLRTPILPLRPISFLRAHRLQQLGRRLGRSVGASSFASQAMNMVATAPENPSNILGWATFLLARHPEHAEIIREQLGRGDQSERLRDVLHETLRLYPGGWAYERIALADDVIAGYHVPKGSHLVFCPYTMHRNPAYWSDPEAFVPERFRGISLRELPSHTYVPFSVGPRRCVGDRYAMVVITRVLARFLARYRVILDPRERGEPWPMFTLRPRTGILARLERA